MKKALIKIALLASVGLTGITLISCAGPRHRVDNRMDRRDDRQDFRGDRRDDRRDFTEDRIDDRQDFREDRRDRRR